MNSKIHHPIHYNQNPYGLECIDYAEHMGFNLGNAFKYVWRCLDKGKPVEDLEKALVYLERPATLKPARWWGRQESYTLYPSWTVDVRVLQCLQVEGQPQLTTALKLIYNLPRTADKAANVARVCSLIREGIARLSILDESEVGEIQPSVYRDPDSEAAVSEFLNMLLGRRSEGPLADAFAPVLTELDNAVQKWPLWPEDPVHAAAIVGEENGELQRAVLMHTYEPDRATLEDVIIEAVQTTAMCIRFIMGVSRYAWRKSVQHPQTLDGTAEPADGRD